MPLFQFTVIAKGLDSYVSCPFELNFNVPLEFKIVAGGAAFAVQTHVDCWVVGSYEVFLKLKVRVCLFPSESYTSIEVLWISASNGWLADILPACVVPESVPRIVPKVILLE